MRLRIAVLMLLCSMPGYSQVVAPRQVLDRVYSFSTGAVLNMNFGNLDTTSPYQSLGLVPPPGSSLNFTTCTVTAIGGLYCLDGQSVRRWKNPLQPASSEVVLNCQTNLGASLGKGSGCVAMTVDLKGQIWLGVKKGNSHSVYKVVPKGVGGCTMDPFCVSEPFVGRPTIVDLVAVDGDLAKNFHPCTGCAQSGVIGIEERKNAVFFPDAAGSTATILVRATDWNLKAKELLQEITLLQLEGTSVTGPVISVLATTTLGRVLTRGTTETGAAREVLNLPARRTASTNPILPASCPGTSEAQFGIRASATTGIVYVSDRNCFQVLALEPNGSTFGGFTTLDYITDLRTSIPGEAYGVIGVTIAPGVSINLTDCSGSTTGCGIVNGPTGQVAASLLNVQLAQGSPSGATVFQIKGIPDCRLAPLLSLEKRAVCAASSGVVVGPPGTDPITIDALTGALTPNLPAAKLKLNVTPLLPDEVKLAFGASGLSTSGQLPPLLISRQYRAQQRTGYIFEAFFIVPQPNVRFQNTYNSDYKVGYLEGLATPGYNCTNPDSLIKWDVTTHVSELYPSVGGEFVDSLANVGCGSIRGAGASMSLLPYDLQVSPDTWNPVSGQITAGNDAVFARLLQDLYGELDVVQRLYACTDPGTGAPISASACGSLTSVWNNGKTKLDKCIAAAFQPKSSASNENCQSFVSQLTNYRNSLPAATPPQDVANRVGELKARIQTIFHLYYDRFQPSIPANGFCRETSACTDPWG
jgi:hypothetical protein